MEGVALPEVVGVGFGEGDVSGVVGVGFEKVVFVDSSVGGGGCDLVTAKVACLTHHSQSQRHSRFGLFRIQIVSSFRYAEPLKNKKTGGEPVFQKVREWRGD